MPLFNCCVLIYLINPSLQAASTPLSPLTFQCEFIKLRIDTLQALSQLICTCNSLKTSPPPAIATTIALTSGNDLQRCGRISMQVTCWTLAWEEWTLLFIYLFWICGYSSRRSLFRLSVNAPANWSRLFIMLKRYLVLIRRQIWFKVSVQYSFPFWASGSVAQSFTCIFSLDDKKPV